MWSIEVFIFIGVAAVSALMAYTVVSSKEKRLWMYYTGAFVTMAVVWAIHSHSSGATAIAIWAAVFAGPAAQALWSEIRTLYRPLLRPSRAEIPQSDHILN